MQHLLPPRRPPSLSMRLSYRALTPATLLWLSALCPLAYAAGSRPVIVTNLCSDTIYPGFGTQEGQGPDTTGFKLDPGVSFTQTVSQAWQGRVWGRTNCSFNDNGTAPQNNMPGKACLTGDCGGSVACGGAGEVPVTLAEFNMDGGDGLTYYDISLVDGYNLPMAIVFHTNSNSSLEQIPPNLTNPSCIATVSEIAAQNFNPYNSGNESFLGTNSSFALPFENSTSSQDLSRWCPWDLQVSPPSKPGDGVYPYPDDNIERPEFDPCFSACAKFHDPADCCTGSHNSASSCKAGRYSKAAKAVCPDAYSFAYDDQTSTFAVPAAGGFEVIFCPGGRSTNIIATKFNQQHKQTSAHQHQNQVVFTQRRRSGWRSGFNQY